MENNTATNQVAIIQNSIEVFQTAPQVLASNQQRTQKAMVVGQSILDQWHEAWAIQDEDKRLQALAAADERSNKFLSNCNQALKDEKELRASITQLMDEFKKMFTACENDIDKSKPNTIPSKVQNNRDTYAAEVAKIQKRKREEAEREAAKKKEVIELRSKCEVNLKKHFQDYLLSRKQKFTEKFNSLVLKDFADEAAAIRQYTPEYKVEHFNSFQHGLWSQLVSMEEINAIVAEVKEGQYEVFAAEYSNQMLELKEDIVSKLPSKFEELNEQKRLADQAEATRLENERKAKERQAAIDKANAEEKAKLEEQAKIENEKEAKRLADLKAQQDAQEAERKKREEEEQAKLKADADAAALKAQQDADIKKQGEQTMVMFDQEIAAASTTEAPTTRTGYEIEILHPVAFTQIFALWFEQEGKNLPIDKIGNTKLDQMKAWAEKQAIKTGTKIESKFLNYKETFKAVIQKPK